MVVVYGAGHVGGVQKIYKGYNEDLMMFDLAQRKAKYTKDKYGITAYSLYVTDFKEYQPIEDYLRRVKAVLASFEHSNATAYPINPSVNRVVVYRTVKNAGDGVCRPIGLATAKILNTTLSDIAHKKNSHGNDWYGVLGRAMKAGCSDAWLNEHGFHTHDATRMALSDPKIRQMLAEDEVDAMANYYKWGGNMRRTLRLTTPIMKGDDVKEFQNAANGIINAELIVDSQYGSASESAAKKLQSHFNLTADGIVGEKTWGAIDLALKEVDYQDLYEKARLEIARLNDLKTMQEVTIGVLQDKLLKAEASCKEAIETNAKLNKELDSVSNAFKFLMGR